jgi:hypothetical protein
MGISAVIAGVLAEDDVLAALLVGGIYSYEQTGRNGISRRATPGAYDESGFLRACAVIKAGEMRNAGAIRDDRAGLAQRVEVYLYDDGDSGYGTLLTARDVLVGLIDRAWLEDAGYVRVVGGAEDLRDPKLNNAAVVRVDFEVRT